MPNRILREGINSSERVDALSAGAELFYRRVMSAVDDYGRFSANPTLIRSAAWPLAPEKHSNAEIQRWLKECVDERLILLYTVAGKQFLQLLDFRQRARTLKYPAPPEEVLSPHEPAECAHDARTLRAQSNAYSESKAYSKSNTNANTESETRRAAPLRMPSAHTAKEPKIESGPNESTFVRFKGLAVDYGIQVSEIEWREFDSFIWRKQDWTQKLAAIKGIEDRIKAGDKSLVDTTPKNYVERRLYERRVRDPPTEQRKSYIDNIQEQMAAHREKKRKMLEANP